MASGLRLGGYDKIGDPSVGLFCWLSMVIQVIHVYLLLFLGVLKHSDIMTESVFSPMYFMENHEIVPLWCK